MYIYIHTNTHKHIYMPSWSRNTTLPNYTVLERGQDRETPNKH